MQHRSWVMWSVGAAALLVALGFGAALRLFALRAVTPSTQVSHRELFPKIPYDRDFFDEAFEVAAAHPAPKADAKVLIVNHHLLGKTLMARAVEAVERPPRRVFVLSPDHFGAGRAAKVTVAEADFDTAYGVVRTDGDATNQFVFASGVQVNNGPVYREHGVHNVMPFIKRAWPDAETVAMIIRPNAADVADIALALHEAVGPEDLLVISADFSHYLTPAATDFHDERSLSEIRSAAEAALHGPDVDCASCLRVAVRFAELRDARAFVLFERTDASRLGAGADLEEGTSYVTGAYVAGPPQPDGVVTALVLPVGMAGSLANDFLPLIDPRREARLFYGQDVFHGWLGQADDRLETLFGAVPAWSDYALEYDVRGEFLAGLWDERTGTVGVRCPNGIEVRYERGGKPSARIANGVFAFRALQGLLLTDDAPAVALGVTCTPDEATVRPFLLQPVEGAIKLASPADTRVYLEQQFGITADIIHVQK